ncbi:MAG: hypothetical protein U9O41_00370 [Candidatus Aerophobetes bacterium]|nr:hypothetical protein [Candidatus Aerophobetes bacterium]
MKLLVVVLNKEEFLEDVLDAFIEADITKATVLDSEGMVGFLAYEVPLFADLKDFMKGDKPYNKTIFSVVDDEKKIKKVEKLIEDICGDLSEPGIGILFTVPVDYAKGFTKKL